MSDRQEEPQQSGSLMLRAWAVHLYTASGLIPALLAVEAIAGREPFKAVLLMVAAMIIDGTDGILARRWNIKQLLPHFDGRKLDDIVDYLTYTFIPLFFADQFALVSGWWRLALFFALLASAYGFCNENAKTPDGFFTGFPSYWNGVVLYLYWLRWPEPLTAAIIVVFAALTFVPVKFLSLNQTPHLRTVNRLLLGVWALMLLFLIFNFRHPPLFILYLSFFYPLFYFGASFYLHKKITPR